MKKVLCAATSAAALTMFTGSIALSAPGDPIFYDNFEKNSWQLWTGHFDQSGSVANGNVSVAGGELVFADDDDATDVLVSTAEHTADVEVETVLTFNATASGAFFSVGLSGATAGGSQFDADVFEDGGSYRLGVFDAPGGGYGGSDVALSPAPAVDGSQSYRMTVTRSGTDITVTLETADGATQLGTTTRDVSAVPNSADFGLLFLKCFEFDAALESITMSETATSTVLLDDDFDGSGIDLANWFAEPNPDVNEGGSGGMRIFNFAASSPQVGGSRPDLQGDGILTVRGGAATSSEFYSRVPSRWNGAEYPWYGDIDLACVVDLIEDSNALAQLSIGLDNRTNEGARYGVLLDGSTSGSINGANNPSLHIVECGGAKGFGATTAIDWSSSVFGTSVSLDGLWDPATETAFLHIQRDGNNFSSFVSDSLGGSPLGGTASADLTAQAPNASGQIVLTGHRGTAEIDDLATWEHSASQSWTLPAPTNVKDWMLY